MLKPVASPSAHKAYADIFPSWCGGRQPGVSHRLRERHRKRQREWLGTEIRSTPWGPP